MYQDFIGEVIDSFKNARHYAGTPVRVGQLNFQFQLRDLSAFGELFDWLAEGGNNCIVQLGEKWAQVRKFAGDSGRGLRIGTSELFRC